MEDLKIVNADNLLYTSLDETEFIIEGILPIGLHIFCGAPKVGKSWLMLDICIKVSKGEEIWNLKTNKCDVLYLALEDTYQRLQKRLFKLTNEIDSNFHISIESNKIANGLTSQLEQTLKIALQNYKNKQEYLRKIYGKKYIYYHIEDVTNEYGKVIAQRIVENYNNEKILDLVFTKENGKYLGTDITRYPFKIIHNELGIEKCRFYDLRGSYATKILNSGIEIRDVANILGHKNIETTENFYISSTDNSRKYATEVFDKAIKSETINKVIRYNVKD